MLNFLVSLTENGKIPDPLLRFGVRKLCSTRLRSLEREFKLDSSYKNYVSMIGSSPVAVETKAANEQHYEVPAEFYKLCLGPNLKYSCAYWEAGCTSLHEAENRSLELTMEHAELRDGMKILELGCGWGSLSLAMAAKFPNASITAVSNSNSQRAFITALAESRGLKNLKVLTRDVSQIEDFGAEKFDRIVSVEMFEHFRNYSTLLGRINNWLNADGKLFVHIFTHKQFPYLFETDGADNWMGKYFFTGGQMPSQNLLNEFKNDLILDRQWEWNGTHYQKTSEAWLKNMDQHKNQILRLFEKTYGSDISIQWFNRWRMFYIAVAELFGFSSGNEWGVTHYLFKKKSARA